MSPKKEPRFFSSESVTEGHPDKICDQISDSILDAIIELDPDARVACEVIVTTGLVLVMGEISTECYVEIPKIVRQTIREIGYVDSKYGFDADNCAVLTAIDDQSSDIALGVDNAQDSAADGLNPRTGAGDQGMMFGYACKETEELMPLPIVLAHKLCQQLAKVRKEGILSYIRPDGKAQVTIQYDGSKPERIDTVVLSTQHDPEIEIEQVKEDIMREVILPILPDEYVDEDIRIYVNPTGRFVIGGPQGDSGLTGRKIIVDTYGGAAPHGGGAFSGKDPTKVDRSASYAARYVAKNLVAADLCSRCEVQLAYAIGVAEPVSVLLETFGTSRFTNEELCNLVKQEFDLTPDGIIEKLDLLRPLYRQTAAYGHFGRTDLGLPWEKIDMVERLKEAAGKL